TINAVQQAYYELVFARERVRVEEQALQLANQLLAATRKQVEFGKLLPLDEQQAEAQVEGVRTELYSARQAFSDRQNALKNLIVDDFRRWADTLIEPGEGLLALAGTFDREESWRTAMASRPDLAQLRTEIEKQGIITRLRFNQLFPSLDLVGAYGLQGAETSFGGTASEIRDQSKPQYTFGVQLSIPLGGNIAARNSYRASKAVKQQAELYLRKAEQDILVQVDDALRQAQSSHKRTESSRAARLYAEAALNAEEKKLREGLSTPFVVLGLQQKLTDARTAEIRALADYNRAQAQLHLSEGSTLEKNHLDVGVK
ncbi:MAG TPA: TolC family protein, partial [Verrucomicrobiae bacterium]|nr:TolC family protein [Verrucomicrobiae bacterium]